MTNVHNTANNVLDLMNYMTGLLSFEPSEPSLIKNESFDKDKDKPHDRHGAVYKAKC